MLSHLFKSFLATPLRRKPSATARLLTQQRRGALEGKGGGRRASGAAIESTTHPDAFSPLSFSVATKQMK